MTSNTRSVELLRAIALQAQDSVLHEKILRDMVDTGMVIARQIQEQAKAPNLTPERQADLAAQFERVSRTMRQTIRFAKQIADTEATRHVETAEEKNALARASLNRSLNHQRPTRKKRI